MKKIDRFRLVLSLLAALLASCQGLEPSATPAPSVPTQTSTPLPTETPLPSATFSPVPPAVSAATSSPTSDHAYQGRPEQFDSLSFLWEYILPAVVLRSGGQGRKPG